MDITKCDICKKTIKKGALKFRASSSEPFSYLDLCAECGKPIKLLIDKSAK